MRAIDNIRTKKYSGPFNAKSSQLPPSAGFAHFEQGFAQADRELFHSCPLFGGRHNAKRGQILRHILSTKPPHVVYRKRLPSFQTSILYFSQNPHMISHLMR